MTESVNFVLEKFQPFRAPLLPQLLGFGLSLQEESKNFRNEIKAEKLAEFLQYSPLFLLQVIADSLSETSEIEPLAGNSKKPSAELNSHRLLEAYGTQAAFELLRQSAQNYSPYTFNDKTEAFELMHWRQSLLCSYYVSELKKITQSQNTPELMATASLLNIGELVLRNVYTDYYLKLHSRTSSESELCRLEAQEFGATHAEIGAGLLERLGVNNFYCDAIRYHHHAFDDITDASEEVKICWFANQLASKEGIDFDLINAGQKFFGLEQEALRAICKKVKKTVIEKAQLLNLDCVITKRLPLADKVDIPAYSEVQEKLHIQVQAINQYNNALLAAGKAGENSIIKAIEKLGEQAFSFNKLVIFRPDSEDQILGISESTKSLEASKTIQLSLGEKPSLIADSFLKAEAVVLDSDSENIKVADLQIISLMEGSVLLCEPLVHKGKTIALIVFGTGKAAAESFLKNSTLRLSLHQLFMELDGSQQLLSTNNNEFYYQEKIREAVHEANNPISIIKNYLQLFNIKQEQDSEVFEEIKVIETEIERVKQILNRLGNDEPATDAESPLDINKIITSINKVFKASIPKEKAISVELDLDPSMPFILGKENGLKQTLINLLKNAYEACGSEGRIAIETKSTVVVNQMNYVRINISDDGPGIENEVMQNLFQQSYTTKGDGHTGTGLMVVKNFMTEIGGLLSCQSDRAGTTFSLLLPRPKLEATESQDRKNQNNNNSPHPSSKVYDFKR